MRRVKAVRVEPIWLSPVLRAEVHVPDKDEDGVVGFDVQATDNCVLFKVVVRGRGGWRVDTQRLLNHTAEVCQVIAPLQGQVLFYSLSKRLIATV